MFFDKLCKVYILNNYKFAEDKHSCAMKKFLTIATFIFLLSSCKEELPSYEHLHPGQKPEQEEQPDTPLPEPDKPSLGYEVSPTGTRAYIDGMLTLTFKSSPTLGTSGKIRILDDSGTEIDMIDMADVAAEQVKLMDDTPYNTTHDLIGPAALKRWRVVNYKPVSIEGNKVIIRPHSNRLDYSKTYSIVIDESAITVEEFKGIAKGEWSFQTKAEPSSKEAVTVAKSGEADFRTIQGAIDWSYKCGPNSAMIINIKNGTYEEQLFARQNNKITFKGESREGVVLQYTNSEEYANGVGGSTSTAAVIGKSVGKSGGRAVILMENCDDIRFENMTLRNTYGKPGQAEVIYNNSNGDYTLAFVNCSLHSLQDTFNTKGYCWMYKCLVEGDCDFIWGSPKTCLFEECEIRAAGDGYIVQARCMSAEDKGFVFLGCSLTKTSDVKDGSMYLARSSGAAEYYDNVAYINCTMSSAIPPQGWYSSPAPNPSKASSASGWKEYGSKDAGGTALSVSGRLQSSYQLTDSEYESGYKDRMKIFENASVGTDWLKE